MLIRAFITLSLLAVAASKEEVMASKAAFVKSLQADFTWRASMHHRRTEEESFEMEEHPAFRRRHVGLLNPNHPNGNDRRQNQQEDFSKEENCDQALLTCLPEEKCAACFRYLYSESVDWGTVSPETSCEDVVGFLAKRQYCPDMHADADALKAFCVAFDACAVWEEDEPDESDTDDYLDCRSLTECDWPGIHKNFIGDGICNDAMGECYNTRICGYDGGDCCKDTCESGNFVECGHDGYMCRDPNSTQCDPNISWRCKNSEIPDTNKPADPAATRCQEGEVKYRLVMFDSFGDGWDQTSMLITPTNKRNDIKFNGGLKSGAKGEEYICLPKESTCMHVEVSGGEWGNEVSWEIRPMTDGAPALGGGGAPMSCDFSVGGTACAENTCNGKANIEPNTDPEYKEFKEMYTCIEQKCTIQVGICESDETCKMCLSEDKDDFCYGSDAFLAVVDCTMCKCTDRDDSEFCHTKLNPAMPQPNRNQNGNGGRMPDGSPRACSPGETMKGSDAVLAFAQCTDLDQVSMLVNSYDENKFGLLDQFEKCAHSFQSATDHGGHTALGCMGILERASHPPDEGAEKEEFSDAIAALAGLLYHQAGDFCECASNASADCPLCSSFIHVKTLLYESLDACQSLDEIDCDAWAEYYTPCKRNIEDTFGAVDFSDEKICGFVHDGCGNAGTFPAFRKLDCGAEISKPAWDFYNDYAVACHGDAPVPVPPPTPSKDATVAPVSPPTPRPTTYVAPSGPKAPPTPRPTSKPYIPSGGGSPTKPYSPPTGGGSPTKPYIPSDYKEPDSDSSGKKSHHLRNFFIVSALCGVGYVYYKRRSDAFSFVRYRNTRNYAGGEHEMYSSLQMDSGSGAFQPPSLPPTPSAIDGSGMY